MPIEAESAVHVIELAPLVVKDTMYTAFVASPCGRLLGLPGST